MRASGCVCSNRCAIRRAATTVHRIFIPEAFADAVRVCVAAWRSLQGELVFRVLPPFPRGTHAAYKSVAELVKTGFGRNNGKTVRGRNGISRRLQGTSVVGAGTR